MRFPSNCVRIAGLLQALVLAACGSAGAPSSSSAQPSSTPASAATSAAAAQGSPEVQRLIAAAKQNNETELDVSWGATFGAQEGLKKLESVFNQMYGTSMRIVYTPGPSMTDMAGKVSQEVTAGQKASSDVLLGTESHYGALLSRNVLEEYDYTKLSPRLIPDVVASKNIGVEIAGIVGGLSYNTNLVPATDVPHQLEGVLDPKWKGKLVSNPDAALMDRVSTRPEWGSERMKEFVRKLSPQVGGLVRCDDNQSITSGQYLMMVLNCGSYQVRRDRAKGAPIGHVIPDDAASIGFFHLGVPKTSAHPNLGKLFIDMMMSEEGQKTIYSIEYTDHYALPGSQSAVELAELKAKRVEPVKVNVKFIDEHGGDLKTLGNELANILREGRSK